MSLASHSASGIRFNDSVFTDPVLLNTWTPPRYAGIVVVLMHDLEWAPKSFQPLYFGEFGNNAPFGAMVRDYSRLVAAANGGALYVSVLPMPFSTIAERRNLSHEFIDSYNPSCQTNFQPADKPRRRIGFMPDTRTAA